MLESIVALIKPSFEAAAAISAAAAVFLKNGERNNIHRYGASTAISALRPLWQGVVLAIIAGLASAYLLNNGAFERDSFDGISKLIASIGIISLLILLWGEFRNSALGRAIVAVSVMVIVFPRIAELALQPGPILAMTTIALNSDLLSKIFGMLFGVLIPVLLGALLIQSGRKLTRISLLLSATVVMLVIFAPQVVGVAQVGLAYGYIPMTQSLLSIFAPLINSYDRFFYGLLAACALYFIAYIAASRRGLPAEASNPAERRKQKASIRNARRLAIGIALTLLLTVSIVAGQSISKTHAKMASELSPAKEISATNGVVYIPVKEINDKKLHRFSYATSDRTEVRFIVVYKGSGLYGVGFDFCDICGPAGYYQRGNDVICKNCDVVINIPTIGFPGGCNPVPLKHKVSANKLTIQTAEFEAVKQKFR